MLYHKHTEDRFWECGVTMSGDQEGRCICLLVLVGKREDKIIGDNWDITNKHNEFRYPGCGFIRQNTNFRSNW